MAEDAESLRAAYRATFTTSHGKKVLLDLARYANVMVAVSPKFPDPQIVSYTEGMRAMFWYIFGRTHDEWKTMKDLTPERGDELFEAFRTLRKDA